MSISHSSLRTPGYYRIRIRASGLPAFTGRVPRLTLWHHQQKKSFGGVDLATTEDPETIRFEGLFPAGGYQIQNYARHDPKYRNRHEHIDASTQPVASIKGGFYSNRTKLVDEDGRPVMPLILFDWVEVEGPIMTEADRARRKDVSRGAGDSANATQRRWRVCWKRPASACGDLANGRGVDRYPTPKSSAMYSSLPPN